MGEGEGDKVASGAINDAGDRLLVWKDQQLPYSSLSSQGQIVREYQLTSGRWKKIAERIYNRAPLPEGAMFYGAWAAQRDLKDFEQQAGAIGI